MILINNIIKDFSYDYDEETVLMPYDYQKKMQQYTGSDWDIWGLTRMKKNEKWYKCYSKFSVSTYREIINSFHQLETFFNNDKNHDYFTKDPRYSLTSIFFNQTNLKYIYINRNDNSKKKSMRDQYGKELFTRNTIKGCSYVSNHFNYKAKYISYNNFKRNYQKILNKIPTNKIIKISYENLINKDNSEINKLENFINKKIITSSILS